ncbi:hypothetical protein BB560_007153 [Smittium megazygosporum]|uniref:Uncharacterized protein n=1 Tax=Smittium megazygosporum TaxID=133381 RepID=A0A2T9XYB8_9FUNG|nr:hypothetical protein BB560_007153 [Smittium megazygosporum]
MYDQKYSCRPPNEWDLKTILRLGIDIQDVGFYDLFNIEEFELDINDIKHFDDANNVASLQFNGKLMMMENFHKNLEELLNDVNKDDIDYKELALSTDNELNGIMYRALGRIACRHFLKEGEIWQVFDTIFYKFSLDRIEGYETYLKQSEPFITGGDCVPDFVIADLREKIRYILIEDKRDELPEASFELIAYMINAVCTNGRNVCYALKYQNQSHTSL